MIYILNQILMQNQADGKFVLYLVAH